MPQFGVCWGNRGHHLPAQPPEFGQDTATPWSSIFFTNVHDVADFSVMGLEKLNGSAIYRKTGIAMEGQIKDIPTLRHKHQGIRLESARIHNVGGIARRNDVDVIYVTSIVLSIEKSPLMKAERLKALRQSYKRF